MKLDQMSSGSSSLLDPLYHTDPTNTSYMVSLFIMFDILDIFLCRYGEDAEGEDKQ